MHRYFTCFFLVKNNWFGLLRLTRYCINPNAGTGMGAAAVFERGDVADELCNARKVDNHNLLSKDVL